MESTIMLQNRSTKQIIPVEVTSYATSKPGLFVHREAYLGHDDKVHYVSKSWVVSHKMSGMSAKPYWHTVETKREMLEIVAQYPDIDWTQSMDTVYKTLKTHGKSVLDVYKGRI